MSVMDWLKSLLTKRGKAISSYRRGMRLAKARDHQGAIREYTIVIDSEHGPDDIKAMALFNRGIAHRAAGEDEKGVQDLEKVMSMSHAPANVKTMARQKLLKRESKQAK